jgi:hypothetical protein
VDVVVHAKYTTHSWKKLVHIFLEQENAWCPKSPASTLSFHPELELVLFGWVYARRIYWRVGCPIILRVRICHCIIFCIVLAATQLISAVQKPVIIVQPYVENISTRFFCRVPPGTSFPFFAFDRPSMNNVAVCCKLCSPCGVYAGSLCISFIAPLTGSCANSVRWRLILLTDKRSNKLSLDDDVPKKVATCRGKQTRR